MPKKTASSARLAAEIPELVRQMAEVAAKPQEEQPENDLDYLLWEAQHDVSPAEWWESLLESRPNNERADAEDAYQWLVQAGCSAVALLEALWEIEEAARSGGQRGLLLEDRRKKLEARDSLTQVAIDATRREEDRKVVLAAWLVLHREADRAAKLAAEAKRDPDADKKRRVYQLAALVARRTGQPHYRKLLPLLAIAGDPWNEPALRTMVSRFAASSGQRLRKPRGPSRRDKVTRKPRGRPRKGETLRLRRRPLATDWDDESDE